MKRSISMSGVAILAGALLAGFAGPASAAPGQGATTTGTAAIGADHLAVRPSLTNDFSISVTPSAGAVNPAYLITTTISTTTTAGAPQTVSFSAAGLPANSFVMFYPSSLTSGNTSTMQISTSSTTPPGVYSIVVTGTGADAVHTTTYTLTVNGPAGCTQTKGTDVTIADNSTVDSLVQISLCAGDASSTSAVEVHIVHTNIGDLVVNLVAPDGSLYLLHNQTGGSTDNIDQTYTVNLSSETYSSGIWKLRVQDTTTGETGYIDTWTLNLRGGCTATNTNNVTIPDYGTGSSVDSSITIEGCPGNASATSTVEVHIVHPRIGDLNVILVSPTGGTYTLHSRTGGNADDIHQTYTVDLSTRTADGTWDLTVWDEMTSQTGYIDSWTLSL